MEQTTVNKKWVSAHLFYTNLNYLLKHGVRPFTVDLKEKNLIDCYFFIRYWEKGPHLRLRMLVSEENREAVEGFIKNYFEGFYEANPSIRKNNSVELFPNNSVHFIEYIPEVERYGGKLAVKIAEDHFQDTSETVLSLMDSYDSWGITIAQGKAFQLYGIFLRAISLSKTEISTMLEIMKNSQWKTKAQQIVGSEDIEDIFSSQYLKNRENIKENMEKLNTIIDSGVLSDFPVLNDFFTCIQKTDNELNLLGEKKLLPFRNDVAYNVNAIKSRIYISYLHMLNNRLGLNNEDEAYLAFLMGKAINF